MRWQKARRPAPDANRGRMPCMIAVLLENAPAPRRAAAARRAGRLDHVNLAYCASVNALYASGRPTLATGPGEVKERRRADASRRGAADAGRQGEQVQRTVQGTPGARPSGSTRASPWPSPPPPWSGSPDGRAPRRPPSQGALHRLERLRRLAGLDAVLGARADRPRQRRARSSRPGSTRSTTRPSASPFNPLIVDDVMYVRGAKGRLVALDAATGKEIWRSTEEAFDRGVSYWESADRTDRRLMVTSRNGLRAGRRAHRAADHDVRRRRHGRHARPAAPRRLGGPNKTPGRIFENLVIVGSLTGEGYGSPPGDIRAYDVRTGALVWTFHTVPAPRRVRLRHLAARRPTSTPAASTTGAR